MNSIYQQTLANQVSCVGIALHTGAKVAMKIMPAAENSGIVFKRTDVKDKNNIIEASYNNVVSANLGTNIANDDGTTVGTIEHLMAAFWGCGIDNAIVEIDGPEVPIMDGSSEPFVFLIECAGLEEQRAPRKVIEVIKSVTVEEDGKKMTIDPSENFSVTLEVDYENTMISKQSRAFNSSDVSFKTDLCRARTFGFEHEVSKLRSMGLARGGSLENAIVVSGNRILNEDGLRYNDEFVRHKILDCIGDFYLAGAHIKGHFHGFRTGHALNNKLLRELFTDKSAWRELNQVLPEIKTLAGQTLVA